MKDTIQLSFTKKEFRDLLLEVMLGSGMLGLLADEREKDPGPCEAIQNRLLKEAQQIGWNDFVQEFEGTLLPADVLCEEEEHISEDYEDSVFWHELETRLGKRDFYRTITSEEEKEMKEQQWLPDRIHDIYDRYANEFEEHGIERLEVIDEDFGDDETDEYSNDEPGAPEDFLFDDCAICTAQKEALLNGKDLTLEELKDAFKKTKDQGGMIGGTLFDEKE